jgi:hypothetical protein
MEMADERKAKLSIIQMLRRQGVPKLRPKDGNLTVIPSGVMGTGEEESADGAEGTTDDLGIVQYDRGGVRSNTSSEALRKKKKISL